MDDQDHDQDMEETSDWMPDRFIPSEEGLDQETYKAFIDYAPNLELITDAESLLQGSGRLFARETPPTGKKGSPGGIGPTRHGQGLSTNRKIHPAAGPGIIRRASCTLR